MHINNDKNQLWRKLQKNKRWACEKCSVKSEHLGLLDISWPLLKYKNAMYQWQRILLPTTPETVSDATIAICFIFFRNTTKVAILRLDSFNVFEWSRRSKLATKEDGCFFDFKFYACQRNFQYGVPKQFKRLVMIFGDNRSYTLPIFHILIANKMQQLFRSVPMIRLKISHSKDTTFLNHWLSLQNIGRSFYGGRDKWDWTSGAHIELG